MATTITGGTWTYSGDPQADHKDAVRFLCGDTDGQNQRISDEEILYLLTTRSVLRAAATAARTIAQQYAKLATVKEVGDLKLQYHDRYKSALALAERLDLEADQGGGVPMAGGISRNRMTIVQDSTDLVDPSFRMHQFGHPGPSAGPEEWSDDGLGS